MVEITSSGDLSKTVKFLTKASNESSKVKKILEKYGVLGIKALSSATPVDSGKTSKSWRYKIEKKVNGYSLTFLNDNIVDGFPVAIMIQYGHATKSGTWVVGSDYINPAIKPIFEALSKEILEEVRR